MKPVQIRPIQKQDNEQIASVIRTALAEFDAPEEGSALGDPEIDYMFKEYSKARSVYFVAEQDGKILGGAGIAPLEAADASICELRKMYIEKDARGNGIGRKLMDACLEKAVEIGFKACYIETFPRMTDAQKLYQNSGFYYLSERKGGTGHSACSVWMQKDL